MGGSRGRQTLQVVATLEQRYKSPPGRLICDGHYYSREIGEIPVGECEAAEQIAFARVEAR